MRRLLLPLLAFVLALGARPRAGSAEGGAPAFVVVVNARNPYTVLDRELIAEAFLKKTTRWPNGEVIKPVDLGPSSPVRERFSNEILKRPVGAVKSYWQQMIFSGRDVPPAEVATDDDVVRFVGTHPGAIGYLSGAARLGDTRPVKVRQ